MRLLLDTNVLLWAVDGGEELAPAARRVIGAVEDEVFVSAASVWEIAIKRGLGRLETPDDLLAAIAATGFAPLAISLAHAQAAGGLPLHHRDPFDRMLLAQARLEALTVVTRDRAFAAYAVDILRA